MREFIALQKRLFPVYFGCQVGLAALTAATHPPYSVVSLAQDLWSAAPVVGVLVTGSLNWFVYGPRTTTTSLVLRALHGESQYSSYCSLFLFSFLFHSLSGPFEWLVTKM